MAVHARPRAQADLPIKRGHMKIAIGQVGHETNTFSKVQTTVESFKRFEWDEGEEIISRYKGVRDYLGGMLDRAEQLGIDVVPTFSALALPSGIITAETYEALRNGITKGLEEASEVDAVCLALHGAGVAEGIDDLEAGILKAVRGIVGYSVPVAATLDLHGNVTEEMLQEADALLGVHLYPHTDSYERGAEAVDLARQIVEGAIHPTMYLTKLPLMLPASTTNLPPARDISEACWAWEKEPAVLDCTFFHGFPYADVPIVGVFVLAITNGDDELAQRVSTDVAQKVWEAREDFFPETPSPTEGLKQALGTEGQPIILNETSDNPGGGSPGDGTHLLRAMLEEGLENACFAFINDPEVARIAHEAGVGSCIDIALGGKTDSLHGEPLEVSAYVKCLTDGRFVQSSPMWRGRDINLGLSARLQIEGGDVVVCSVNAQVLDEQVFLLHGIDVATYKVVGLKSSQHFRAAFEDLSERIITVDSPGLGTLQLTTFDYTRLVRPIYPLDEIWKPTFQNR